MSFDVVFTDEASFQVLQIQEWIAERSLTGAQSWLAAFRLAIDKLRERGPGFNLAGLILQSAAAYSQTAETIAFGPDFTAELHRNNSWQDSLAFQDLTNYQGKVCLIYWQHDDVVPSGVIKKYFDSIGAKARSLTIPGAGHSMLRPRNEHERRGWEQMYDYSLSFIQGKV